MIVTDLIGYLAAALVVATFYMRSMKRLRCTALASNLAFIAYGYLGELAPVLVLHLLLLPINLYRLSRLLRPAPHGTAPLSRSRKPDAGLEPGGPERAASLPGR